MAALEEKQHGQTEQVETDTRQLERKQEPGFCSASCTDRICLERAIKRPHPKTSDLFVTCDLPARFEHPHWFNGYGCQKNKQHPMYRTSNFEYGYYTPGYHTVCNVFYPLGQTFTNKLAAAEAVQNKKAIDDNIFEGRQLSIKTSEKYLVLNHPERFDIPLRFHGYGVDNPRQHHGYKTTSSDYGWYPPDKNTVPNVYPE